MTKHIGILTAGGDSPGLNAAIRAVGKTAQNNYGMHIIGFRDGFRGLMENRIMRLDGNVLSGILTIGGTILGTSRDKPHRMTLGGKIMDMTDAIVDNYEANHLDALVCLGGGGTQKNALRLKQKGLNILTLPKTIDNDVAMTDITFGFDTALGIATDAIDRLHSTAHSHHRIIVVEVMGHKAGWLALGAGIAGGADVILLPEIPYQVSQVAEAILKRIRNGKSFSIVAVAEGAMSSKYHKKLQKLMAKKRNKKIDKEKYKQQLEKLKLTQHNHTLQLSQLLEQLTGVESRVTILGHIQRGGAPSAADRILATRLGTACMDMIYDNNFGVMTAVKGDDIVGIPLEQVAGKTKLVPHAHPMIKVAKEVGTNFGD